MILDEKRDAAIKANRVTEPDLITIAVAERMIHARERGTLAQARKAVELEATK